MSENNRNRNQLLKMKGGRSMIRKMISRMHRAQRGITGLETAIILIAFVVVASVFAYTVLSAGLFSTQKSQEAIHSGLEEAQSTMELKGGVIAMKDGGSYVNQITFTVANVLKGEAIDFTPPTSGAAGSATGTAHTTIISYLDKDQKVKDLYWTTSKLGNADTDDLLENGEQFQITIGSTTHANPGGLDDALSPTLSANKTFSIEVKASKGAVLTIERTTPAYIDDVMNLN